LWCDSSRPCSSRLACGAVNSSIDSLLTFFRLPPLFYRFRKKDLDKYLTSEPLTETWKSGLQKKRWTSERILTVLFTSMRDFKPTCAETTKKFSQSPRISPPCIFPTRPCLSNFQILLATICSSSLPRNSTPSWPPTTSKRLTTSLTLEPLCIST
jgi:hypothetical protein